MYKDLKHFNVWCQKVLPLVYDDSLSYYEILCKVVDYINSLIENDKIINDELTDLKSDMKVVQKWIAEFDTAYFKETVNKYVNERIKMVTFGLTDSGHLVAYIPSGLSDIQCNTTRCDVILALQPEYGHLVLSMEV